MRRGVGQPIERGARQTQVAVEGHDHRLAPQPRHRGEQGRIDLRDVKVDDVVLTRQRPSQGLKPRHDRAFADEECDAGAADANAVEDFLGRKAAVVARRQDRDRRPPTRARASRSVNRPRSSGR
jgi:hypothetical protein